MYTFFGVCGGVSPSGIFRGIIFHGGGGSEVFRGCIFQDNFTLVYAADVLLVARTHRGLLSNFTILTNELSKIGLSVNASKCDFICVNSPYEVAPFVTGTAVLPCSSSISWLGLCFGSTLTTTCSSLVNQAMKNLRVA